MKKSITYIILVVLALIMAVLIFLLVKPKKEKTNNNSTQIISQNEQENNIKANEVTEKIELAEPLKATLLELSGTLSDVTGGQSVRGIITNNTSGAVSLIKTEDGFTVTASFENLPDPESDDFYEGWIVRKNPLNPISTGKLKKEADGTWSNTFTTEQDLTGYTFYVLTIEPNDGDPAPADHILEGDLFPL